MATLIERPPLSAVEPVTDVLHGVSIVDPYRWLEQQDSLRTRAWINEQTRYARTYLDRLPGRERIRKRLRELLDVESFDSFLKIGSRYFFRKRLRGQEQPAIYLRNGAEGQDHLLIDPATRGSGPYTAVRPLRPSPDGSLLLYEVKQGGERTGIFEIFDVRNHTVFPDSLPHGFLRAFAFASDGKSFYYVHEPTNATRPFPAAVYHHALGIPFIADQRLFSAPEGGNPRLTIIPGRRSIGLLIQRFLKGTSTDFYVSRMGNGTAVSILRNADYRFAPRIVGGRILATTNRDAPNRRIVEIQPRRNQDPLFFDVIPEGNAPIRAWYVTANYILVSYSRPAQTQTHIFDSYGKRLGQIPSGVFETLRVLAADWDDDDVLLERESFAQPIEIERYSLTTGACTRWAQREVPIEAAAYKCAAVSYPSRDRTNIPLSLVGKSELFVTGTHPVAMTAYGGYGVPATPQFSVFVAFLIERGCLFALPNIRGGSEFGVEWHHAAKRQNRQVAIDDFLSAAEWLIETGRTTAEKLAIFGGSNSGLLVGAALTQRPHLFRAVLCMVPMLDMLRYELFDNAHVWNDEFGTIDDIDDFRSLAKYSPYHAVRPDQTYPATMFVSGDADQNCNPLHARKMTARLQAANASHTPIFLDYSPHRGHSPVLPLTERVNALTDRLAFFCNQLGLGV